MSDEVETMAYAGQTPWHGRGVKLEVPVVLVEEALKAGGLDWTVHTEPVYLAQKLVVPDEGGREVLGRKVPNRFAVLRDTDQAILGTVGQGWRPLQNRDAFAPLQAFLAGGLATVESVGSLRGGARVWMLLKIAREACTIVGDDIVEKYLLVAQGHDGAMSVHFGITMTRVVCMNTLSAAIAPARRGGAPMVRIRHSASAQDGIKAASEFIVAADARFDAAAEVFRALSRRQITGAELRDYILTVFPRRKKGSPEGGGDGGEGSGSEKVGKVEEQVTELFEGKGRGSDLAGVKGTAWGAYNAVTEFLSHHRGRSQDARLENLWFGEIGTAAAITARELFLSS
jgi:phage/plasmid-like protein (TIGR03299 family)